MLPSGSLLDINRRTGTRNTIILVPEPTTNHHRPGQSPLQQQLSGLKSIEIKQRGRSTTIYIVLHLGTGEVVIRAGVLRPDMPQPSLQHGGRGQQEGRCQAGECSQRHFFSPGMIRHFAVALTCTEDHEWLGCSGEGSPGRPSAMRG